MKAFNEWSDKVQVEWLRVDYLRSLKQSRDQLIPFSGKCLPGGVHVGSPPPDAQLYVVSYAGPSPSDRSPGRHVLDYLVAVLDNEPDIGDIVNSPHVKAR